MRNHVLAAAVALILATPSLAQPPSPKEMPLFDAGRIAVAGALSYDWHAGDAVTPEPAFRKEFAAGATAAYVLTEHVSATGAAMYGLDSKQWRFSPGVHLRQRIGSEFFAFGLSYDYYAGHPPAIPTFAHEWAASVIYARPIGGNLLLGASTTYGFDNREFRTSLGVRFPLYLGGKS
jgi:hypothetical protein